MKHVVAVIGLGCVMLSTLRAADLSPAHWPQAERERVEKIEALTWAPLEAQAVAGDGGVVSATVSAVAVQAGIETLRQGGSAADAATTVALTQITTQLGSVVSYAGIFTMVYYDVTSRKVYSLDAGYNSYLHETDPATIPVGDLGPMHFGSKPTEGGAKGRETLVPGFMTGVEAMHGRFGRLPWAELFTPAVWYCEKGLTISPTLAALFQMRAKFLARTPEGQAFMRQGGGEIPEVGARFVQTELARTLKAVAEQGSRYLYAGEWGQEFVRIVQREGGKVTNEDMERYRPTWNEPYQEISFGHTIFTNGAPHLGAYGLFGGLHLAEALKFEAKGAYWTDAETFRDLARINAVVATAPAAHPRTAEMLRARDVEVSPDAQLGKPYAQALAPLLNEIFAPPVDDVPKHSNAIVVIDREGNVAAITHTINAVIWGDTGIVVGGVPIPDSAGFQQRALAAIKPGDRVPHQIIDTIVLREGWPVLATASIGSSLLPESIRVLAGVLGQGQNLTTVMAAPPLLTTYPTGAGQTLGQQTVSVPQGAYAADYLTQVRARGVNVVEIPAATADALRGTLAAVVIDPKTGRRSAVNQPGMMVFSAAE